MPRMLPTTELRSWVQEWLPGDVSPDLYFIFRGLIYNDSTGLYPDGINVRTSRVRCLICHPIYYTAITLDSTYILRKSEGYRLDPYGDLIPLGQKQKPR